MLLITAPAVPAALAPVSAARLMATAPGAECEIATRPISSSSSNSRRFCTKYLRSMGTTIMPAPILIVQMSMFMSASHAQSFSLPVFM